MFDCPHYIACKTGILLVTLYGHIPFPIYTRDKIRETERGRDGGRERSGEGMGTLVLYSLYLKHNVIYFTST